MCLVPPVYQLTAEGAQWGEFLMPFLLFSLSEEQYQAHLPERRAGFQDQGTKAPAETYSTDEYKDADIPSGYDLRYWYNQWIFHFWWLE